MLCFLILGHRGCSYQEPGYVAVFLPWMLHFLEVFYMPQSVGQFLAIAKFIAFSYS